MQAEEWYDEAAVGRAISAWLDEGGDSSSGGPGPIEGARSNSRQRGDLFVTTKMHPRDHGFESTKRRVRESRANLSGGGAPRAAAKAGAAFGADSGADSGVQEGSQGEGGEADESQLPPLDLFLLHYPACWPGLCAPPADGSTWRDSWRALEVQAIPGTSAPPPCPIYWL